MSKKRKEQKAIAPADQPAEPEVDQTQDVAETASPAETDLPEGQMPPEPTDEQIAQAVEGIPQAATAPDEQPAGGSSEIGIQQVLRRVAEEIDQPLPASYRPRLQEVRLTPEQAETAARVHGALRELGVPLRKVGDVFGWLLDQVASAARQ